MRKKIEDKPTKKQDKTMLITDNIKNRVYKTKSRITTGEYPVVPNELCRAGLTGFFVRDFNYLFEIRVL